MPALELAIHGQRFHTHHHPRYTPTMPLAFRLHDLGDLRRQFLESTRNIVFPVAQDGPPVLLESHRLCSVSEDIGE